MTHSAAAPRLLFVDDEANIRATLPLILGKAGFEVYVAESVGDALFEINSHRFDILISDLNIGEEGDGFLLISAVRRLQPHCLTFILTGYPAFETALQAIQSHVDDYLVKPVEIDSLMNTLWEKLRRRAKTSVGGKRLSAVLKHESEGIAGRAARTVKPNGEDGGGFEQALTWFLDALVEQLELGQDEPSSQALRTASDFGNRQVAAGLDPVALAALFRSLEQEAYGAIENHGAGSDMPTLLCDLRRLTAGLHLLLEASLDSYAVRTGPRGKKVIDELARTTKFFTT
jgi:ActR/RegA family two-component response regulator